VKNNGHLFCHGVEYFKIMSVDFYHTVEFFKMMSTDFIPALKVAKPSPFVV
jgi:hypothetical protein